MTDIENEEVTLAEKSEAKDTAESEKNIAETEDTFESEESTKDTEGERESDIPDAEEYESLVKRKYKELYDADMQRLINRRFKKYKALEEKVKRLEEQAQRYADIDSQITAERERAVRETEERMNMQFRAMRSRAEENALSSHTSRSAFDVSRLTKAERALLASRAQKGEKIHF